MGARDGDSVVIVAREVSVRARAREGETVVLSPNPAVSGPFFILPLAVRGTRTLLPPLLRREKGHFVPTKKPATLFCIDKAIYS